MDYIEQKQAKAILEEAIRPIGAQVVCADMDPEKGYGTLRGELNSLEAFDGKHKLGLATTAQILRSVCHHTGNKQAPLPFLRHFCGLFGYVPVERYETRPSKNDVKDEALLAGEELGRLQRDVVAFLAPDSEAGEKTGPEELRRLMVDADAVLAQLTRVLGGMLARSEEEPAADNVAELDEKRRKA